MRKDVFAEVSNKTQGFLDRRSKCTWWFNSQRQLLLANEVAFVIKPSTCQERTAFRPKHAMKVVLNKRKWEEIQSQRCQERSYQYFVQKSGDNSVLKRKTGSFPLSSKINFET